MATRFTFSVKGTRRLINQLKKRQGAAFDAAKRVQNGTAKDIITESNRIVPKDQFNLVRSARIKEDMTPKKNEIRTIGITYNEDYAYVVHEDMDAKHAPGTSAKYLEKPARKNRRPYALNMKRAIQGALK